MTFTPTRRFASTLLLLAAFACLSSACRTDTTPQTNNANAPDAAASAGITRERTVGTPGGSLTYRVSTPPKTLNSLMIADEASYAVAFIMMGGRLVEFDHDKQGFAPGLAESWQLGADGKTLEMTLRDGLKFSDGHPLTSEDVAFTFRGFYDKATNSIFKPTMTIDGKQIEVVPVDARRFRVVFPDIVASPETYLVNVAVLPRHVLEAELKQGTLKDAYSVTSDPQRVVTAGAFAVESIAPGERVTLKRNPHFWKKDASGNQLPYLERINVVAVSDANAAITQLGQGALDIVDRIRPTDYVALKNQQGGGAQARAYDLGPGLGTDHLWFNLSAGTSPDGKPRVEPAKLAWFSDVRFRRAVAYAVDRQSIVTSVSQGLATPLYGFVSPGNRAWAATEVVRTDYDLARSRSLLDEAGFETRGTAESPELFDTSGRRVEFTLIVPVENEPRKSMAAVIQEDLARLGVKMNIAPIEFGELKRRTQQGSDYDAALLGATPTDPDPSSYSNILNSSSVEHQWHPNQQKPATEWEARVDTMLAALSRETDRERRRTVFRDIQLTLMEHQPIIPIVARHVVVAANPRVGNYRPSVVIPFSMWNAEELFVKK